MVCGQAVKTLTGLVASFITTEEEKDYELWRADEDDIESISAPASRIIWRRLPDDAKGSDTIDLLQLTLGIAGYLGKNLKTQREIRRAAELDQAAGEDAAA
jgi:hypothetical protein